MDLADHAQGWEESEREAALKRHANRQREAAAASVRGRVCIDCGERIPGKRLAAHPHAVRCIDDARRYEQRRRHFVK